MISAIFLFSTPNVRSSSQTHPSNNSENTQLFKMDLYRQGKYLAPLKHFGFCDFPITNIGSLSPKALTTAKPFRLALQCFPSRFDKISQTHPRWRCLLMDNQTKLLVSPSLSTLQFISSDMPCNAFHQSTCDVWNALFCLARFHKISQTHPRWRCRLMDNQT